MSDDLWNWVAGTLFCLPTIQSARQIMRQQLRTFERGMQVLEDECANKASSIDAKRKQMKRLAEQNRPDECRRKAIEMRQLKVQYQRVGRQKDNLTRLHGQLQEQFNSAEIDKGLLMVCSIMTKRRRTMHPERFRRMMDIYKATKQQQTGVEQALQEFWKEDEDQEYEKEEEQLYPSEDAAVQQIYAEYNIEFPDTPSRQVHTHGGSVSTSLLSSLDTPVPK